MSLMQRRKGKVFERRVADDLRQAFPAATVRRSSQADHAHNSDVVVDGDAPELVRRIWWECHDARNPQPLEKLAQAERDVFERRPDPSPIGAVRRASEGRVPVVVYHRLGERGVRVMLRLSYLAFMFAGMEPPGLLSMPFGGIPVALDWDQFLDLLRGKAEAKEVA